jgi:hypothetical protein
VDPDLIRIRDLMTKNWRKKIPLEILKSFFDQKLQCPCNGRGLQPSKENIEHFKK